mmetsp:Transcript_95279/g.307094  ORF Transcript_95279/g.307094 Transcript_95279/m.307094 type:complete len:223 (+) Transcript_95279:89-757(+)
MPADTSEGVFGTGGGPGGEGDGSAHAPALRGVKRSRQSAPRVTFDEDQIALHDLDRGTRQKIDEPKTPWAGSPASSEDEVGGEKAPRRAAPDPVDLASRLSAWSSSRASEEIGDTADADAATGSGEAAAEALFAELEAFGPDTDGATAAPAPPPSPPQQASGGQGSRDPLVIIRGPGDPDPKPASASFRAKRAKHYNEFKALQAFRESNKSDDESEDSEKKA